MLNFKWTHILAVYIHLIGIWTWKSHTHLNITQTNEYSTWWRGCFGKSDRVHIFIIRIIIYAVAFRCSVSVFNVGTHGFSLPCKGHRITRSYHPHIYLKSWKSQIIFTCCFNLSSSCCIKMAAFSQKSFYQHYDKNLKYTISADCLPPELDDGTMTNWSARIWDN
jgi:uncharacterized Zn-finger protein